MRRTRRRRDPRRWPGSSPSSLPAHPTRRTPGAPRRSERLSASSRAVHSAPPRSAPCSSSAVERPPSSTTVPARGRTSHIAGFPARRGSPVPWICGVQPASFSRAHTCGRTPPAAQRVRLRRARTVRGALAVTLLGAVVPGAGLLWTGRLVGYFLLVPAVGGSVYLLGAFRDWGAAVELAADPEQLRSMSVVLGVGLGVWALSVVATYWCARPRGARRLPSTAGRRHGARLSGGRPAGGADHALRDGPGGPGRDTVHREPHRHRAARHQRGGSVGRA